MNFPKKAIILAGGLGTRLRPVTNKIPKALIDVQGKTLTEHNIDILKHFGVEEIILSLGYKAQQVIDYFKDKNLDVVLDFVIEDAPLGTAAPLILLPKFKETFVMINGDNLFALDFKKMFEFHKKNKAMATIALTSVEDVTAFGVAKMDGDKIVDFIEKPKKEEAPSSLINSGYYILEPEVFDLVKGKEKAMVEKDVFPAIAKKGELYGYKDEGQWFDTGTFERWEKVQKEWKGLGNY